VLELLETVNIDERVVELCARTRKNGYQFALDDFTAYDGAFESMFRIASYVKIDLMATDRSALPELVGKLKKYNLKLLAEKVETHEDFQECRDLGFDYFRIFLRETGRSYRASISTHSRTPEFQGPCPGEEFFVIEASSGKIPRLPIKLSSS